jgi:hypothetical protein
MPGHALTAFNRTVTIESLYCGGGVHPNRCLAVDDSYLAHGPGDAK